MRPPIIADNRGDVLVFDTVAAAESYMEPVDVRNDEYIVFDSEGRFLTPSVESARRGERTLLKDAEPTPAHASEARKTLLQVLMRSSRSAPGMEQMTLAQLIDLMPRSG
jgi:hypothetical protein